MNTKVTLTVGLAAFAAVLMPASVFAQSYDIPSTPGPGAYSAPTSGLPAAQCYVPAGMMLNASLQTSISTEAARPGDVIDAMLTQSVMTGNGQIPAGTVLEGHVTTARSGGFLGRSGELTVKFDHLRTPNGMSVPMSAHISGDLGKYKGSASGSTFHGEGAGTKVGQALLRTAVGAGAGAALGTAVGAIAGHGNPTLQYRTSMMPYSEPMGMGMGMGMTPVSYYQNGSGAARGAGRGAWSGAAIGGGVGLADSLLLRKGHNVVIQSGTQIQLLLDAPIQIDRGQYGAT